MEMLSNSFAMRRPIRCAAAMLAGLSCFVGGPASAQIQPKGAPQTAPAATPPVPAQPPAPGAAPSGQPMPRFVSLKSDRVNMRTGPGTEYPMQWVYRRAGLPVEVVREYEAWRQVRDAEGATGWVLASLLSGRRTALVEPWLVKPETAVVPQVALKTDGREGSADVAQVEAGVIANVRTCDGRWCFVAIGDFRGYVQQNKLWGVYKGETVR